MKFASIFHIKTSGSKLILCGFAQFSSIVRFPFGHTDDKDTAFVKNIQWPHDQNAGKDIRRCYYCRQYSDSHNGMPAIVLKESRSNEPEFCKHIRDYRELKNKPHHQSQGCKCRNIGRKGYCIGDRGSDLICCQKAERYREKNEITQQHAHGKQHIYYKYHNERAASFVFVQSGCHEGIHLKKYIRGCKKQSQI